MGVDLLNPVPDIGELVNWESKSWTIRAWMKLVKANPRSPQSYEAKKVDRDALGFDLIFCERVEAEVVFIKNSLCGCLVRCGEVERKGLLTIKYAEDIQTWKELAKSNIGHRQEFRGAQGRVKLEKLYPRVDVSFPPKGEWWEIQEDLPVAMGNVWDQYLSEKAGEQ